MFIFLGVMLWIIIGVVVLFYRYTRYGGGDTMAMMSYGYPALVIVLLVLNVVFWPIAALLHLMQHLRHK